MLTLKPWWTARTGRTLMNRLCQPFWYYLTKWRWAQFRQREGEKENVRENVSVLKFQLQEAKINTIWSWISLEQQFKSWDRIGKQQSSGVYQSHLTSLDTFNQSWCYSWWMGNFFFCTLKIVYLPCNPKTTTAATVQRNMMGVRTGTISLFMYRQGNETTSVANTSPMWWALQVHCSIFCLCAYGIAEGRLSVTWEISMKSDWIFKQAIKQRSVTHWNIKTHWTFMRKDTWL